MSKKLFSGFAVVALATVVLLAALISCDTSVDGEGRVPPPPPPPPGPIYPEWDGGISRSIKRGVSYNFLYPRSNPVPREDMELLAPGVKWFYNWNHHMPVPAWAVEAGILEEGEVEMLAREHEMVFIPQIWGGRTNWAANFDLIYGRIRGLVDRNPEIRWLMAYNEPMLTVEANLTPMQAAADWPHFMRLARELDLKVISPALTFGNIGSSIRVGGVDTPRVPPVPAWNTPDGWFDAFLEQDGVSLDDMYAIRVHNYMGWIGPLQDYIERFRRYDRPIWVTEFAAWGNPLQPTDEEWQMRFMSEAVTYFELEPLVKKYFWFIPKGGENPLDNEFPPFNKLLTHASPTQLTRLGVVYVNMPAFDREVWVPSGHRMTAGHMTNANITRGQFVHFRPTEDTAEGSEVLDVHNFIENRWIEFQAEIRGAGSDVLLLRNVAHQATTMDIHVNGMLAATVELAQTNEWRTTEIPLMLASSWSTIRLTVREGNIAVNWLKLE
ncbi:MAG: glycoside hydrolase family protein [Treponema sp.]|nr:glycoside hydrolase family protein [Treponema sp.]